LGLSSRCGSDCAASIVIDYLGIYMLAGEMNGQSRTLGSACNSFPDPPMNALPRCLTNRRHAY
jgi:hypothetical protein